jgi:hypothetical protein
MAMCSVDGCDRAAQVRDLCRMHHKRVWRTGSVERKIAKPGEPALFLKSHVDFDGADCLIWPFGRSGGYGYLDMNGKICGAHREMCILAHGEPPFADADAAHSCGNGKQGCIHPKHLRWATAKQNVQDQIAHGTFPRGEKHTLAKLTAEVALAVYADRRPAKIVAAAHGCSVSSVRNVWYGQAWAWLTGHTKAA